MPQVEKGLRISGDGKTRICYGLGDPNTSTDHFVRTAGQGSLYMRQAGGANTTAYFATGTQVEAATGQTIALWTAK